MPIFISFRIYCHWHSGYQWFFLAFAQAIVAASTAFNLNCRALRVAVITVTSFALISQLNALIAGAAAPNTELRRVRWANAVNTLWFSVWDLTASWSCWCFCCCGRRCCRRCGSCGGRSCCACCWCRSGLFCCCFLTRWTNAIMLFFKFFCALCARTIAIIYCTNNVHKCGQQNNANKQHRWKVLWRFNCHFLLSFCWSWKMGVLYYSKL